MTAPILPQNPSPDTFGAPYTNADGVVNPETDLDATLLNLLIAQVCAASFTAPRALAQVSVAGSTATLGAHGAVWGDASVVSPVVSRGGPGVYLVAWASSQHDLQVPTPETKVFAIRAAKAFANTVAPLVPSVTWSGSTATVRLFDLHGTPTDGSFTVEVW